MGLLLVGAVSCTKYNEPDPPSFTTERSADELPRPTHTIAQLKELYTQGGLTLQRPIVVEATIASDDTEGNVYRSCYIQDSTGGMELKFALGNLSTIYPQGARVRLLCQDLQLGAYGGQVGLGYRSTDAHYETAFLPEKFVQQHLFIVGRSELQPRVLSLSELSTSYAGTLVRIEGVQFAASELGQTYASPEQRATLAQVNRTLTDRTGAQLVVRTSSYARFAGKQLPKGSGSVTGILSYFRTTPQLIILREQDVQLTDARF